MKKVTNPEKKSTQKPENNRINEIKCNTTDDGLPANYVSTALLVDFVEDKSKNYDAYTNTWLYLVKAICFKPA